MILRGAITNKRQNTSIVGDQYLETNEADRTTGTIDACFMPNCLPSQSRR